MPPVLTNGISFKHRNTSMYSYIDYQNIFNQIFGNQLSLISSKLNQLIDRYRTDLRCGQSVNNRIERVVHI